MKHVCLINNTPTYYYLFHADIYSFYKIVQTVSKNTCLIKIRFWHTSQVWILSKSLAEDKNVFWNMLLRLLKYFGLVSTKNLIKVFDILYNPCFQNQLTIGCQHLCQVTIRYYLPTHGHEKFSVISVLTLCHNDFIKIRRIVGNKSTLKNLRFTLIWRE